jgi:Fur family peroxide stress response transcriptional regulator
MNGKNTVSPRKPHAAEPPSIDEVRARVEQLRARLVEHGFRVTPQRLYILQALVEARHHPDAEELFRAVRAKSPTTSLATIYKTLDTLKEVGEVLELEFSNGPNRYDGLMPDAHPHIVCTRCGQIEDLELSEPDAIDTMAQLAAASSGYQIRSHRVEFYGVCGTCQAAPTSAKS